MKTFEFIENNLDAFKDFVRIGIIPTTVMTHYQIFCVYRSAENIPAKMNRLYFTSDICKVSPIVVRKALRTMNAYIPKYLKQHV